MMQIQSTDGNVATIDLPEPWSGPEQGGPIGVALVAGDRQVVDGFAPNVVFAFADQDTAPADGVLVADRRDESAARRDVLTVTRMFDLDLVQLLTVVRVDDEYVQLISTVPQLSWDRLGASVGVVHESLTVRSGS